MNNRIRITLTAAITVAVFTLGVFVGNAWSARHNLDMETIIDYKVSDDGLMLYTNDGNGYWWEVDR